MLLVTASVPLLKKVMLAMSDAELPEKCAVITTSGVVVGNAAAIARRVAGESAVGHNQRAGDAEDAAAIGGKPEKALLLIISVPLLMMPPPLLFPLAMVMPEMAAFAVELTVNTLPMADEPPPETVRIGAGPTGPDCR